ncbi:MAG: CHASE2 domain-containing protein [Conexibacter sp.]
MPWRPPARLVRALVVGALAAGIAGLLAATGLLAGFERTALDARYQVRGTHAAPDVVVVGIDEATLAEHELPFSRALHARVIRTLLAADARAVAYDVQFSSARDRAGDEALLRALDSPRVVLGTAEQYRDGTPAVLGVKRLQRQGTRIGSTLLPVDDDGAWRRMDARVQGLPALSVLAAHGDPDAGTHPIDFAGPPGTIREISFLDVLDGRFPRGVVRGRMIVVGVTAVDEHDAHPTAAGDALMPGAEIHANAIQTILDGYPLRDAPALAAVLLVLAAGLLAPLATLVGSPSRALAQALGAGALGTATLLGGAQLAFDAGAIVPIAAPLLALVLGTLGAVALTYVFEVRARRHLRTTFERFVSPDVAAELLPEGDAAPRLESRRLEATVLFCDLRGFTTLAERLEAEQVIAVLNRYLDAVSTAVFAHGGTVVSYQGDGVLAVFGAPLPQPDHAVRALAVARDILDTALPRFNAWLLEERLADAPLDAGIGLNSGHVMSGLVGSERRVEYAAVGDATNVAARLQALGREIPGPPTRLFVSETTHAQLGPAADGLRRHGTVELKGRREPVTVYVGG